MRNVVPVVSFYDRWARVYDAIARYTPGIQGVRARVVESLNLQSGDTVVEMGCGTGANLAFLREKVGSTGRVIGIDITPGVLRLAKRRVASEGWDNVHLVLADAAAPPIARPVDAVLGTFVVGMFDDPAAVVGTWCDITRGRVALLNAIPSPRTGMQVLNAVFRAVVVISTPPTLQVRYSESPARRLARRVEAAQTAVHRYAQGAEREEFALGFLRLTIGRFGER